LWQAFYQPLHTSRSWHAVGKKLGVPVMTIVGAYFTETPSDALSETKAKHATSPAMNPCTAYDRTPLRREGAGLTAPITAKGYALMA
jgi:hypothetical protein